jgi:hypothetical protein
MSWNARFGALVENSVTVEMLSPDGKERTASKGEVAEVSSVVKVRGNAKQ